jgi:hypothetical protein
MLVLASDTDPIYLEHQRLWRTYMHTNPNVDCYFYKGDPTREEEATLEGDTLVLKIEDRLDTVYEKTLRAFDFFAPRLKDYKCVFRTNLSSVVVFDRYLTYCRGIPDTTFCSAFVGDMGEEDGNLRFPAGAGITLTPDLVLRLIAERPPLLHQDDVTIGKALTDWGVPMTHVDRADLVIPGVYENAQGRISPHLFHFRVKQNVRHETGAVTPYEITLMQKVISQFYDDPMTRRIEVVMRMCPESRSPQAGSASRPDWFTKESSFRSVYLTRGPNVYFTVMFDGDPTDHWIHSYDVTVVPFTGGTDTTSYLFLMRYLAQQQYPDNTIVYCLEDDYPHRPGWPTILREGFAESRIKFDYLTLYDHGDKYTYDMYAQLTSRICSSPSTHWRTTPSTTNTWAMLGKTFREDFDILWGFQNRDHEKFLALGRKGRTLGSCLPGYSTHAHTEHLSPHWDWSFVREL